MYIAVDHIYTVLQQIIDADYFDEILLLSFYV